MSKKQKSEKRSKVMPFIFSFFYIFWLAICFFISLPGFLIPFKKKELESSVVKKHYTICRCLFEKGVISEKTYAFETDQVSKHYDQLVFKGYTFIVVPVIFTLRKSKYIDNFILYFVERWVAVHKYQFKQINVEPPIFHRFLVKVCISISRAVGSTLTLLKL